MKTLCLLLGLLSPVFFYGQQLKSIQACFTAGPQSVLNDAIALNNAIDQNKVEVVNSILCKYYGVGQNCQACVDNDYALILSDIRLDPNYFLTQVLPLSLSKDLAEEEDPKTAFKSAPQSAALPAGILDPTTALDAIASLIAKRLTDELNLAYLDRLRATLQDPRFDDFQILLPETRRFLVTLGQNQVLDYKNLLSGLRQNLFEDLNNLTLHTPEILQKYRDTICASPAGTTRYVLGMALLEALNSAKENSDPASIIHRVGNYDYALPATASSDALTLLQLGALISDHLRINAPHGPWTNNTKDLQNPRTIYLFAGLLYRKERAFFAGHSLGGVSLVNLINSGRTQQIVDLIYQALGLINDLALLQDKLDPEAHPVEAALSLSERLLNFVMACQGGGAAASSEALQSVRKVLSIRRHILEKEFVAAGTLAISFVDSMTGLPTGNTEEFFRYLSFAQNLIDAKTKEELLEALEQAADPVGNYRLKRSHPLTVSITSFPGLFAGREQYEAGVNNKTMFNTFGLTAPLGLAVSFSGNKNGPGSRLVPELKKQKISYTVFVPVLDVGAITALRLVDQNAELPELEWKNFIAPGLFLNLGFKNSPLSIHAGAQVGPSTIQIGSTRPRLWRFGAGVSVDLHLWSIYTKAGKVE
ncbi:MAG: hypothetical protein IT260_03860 [Saprospiraceae bacterium]|nr:hypothetical protein [Saprospiraceae bacterium]